MHIHMRRKLRFDLHYYDGLANQDEVIRLTTGTFRDVPTSANVIVTPTDNSEGRGSLVEDACAFELSISLIEFFYL